MGIEPKGNNRRTPYKSPLADIEFNAASDILKYADKLRQIGRAEQLELHTAADELEAVLANSAGNIFNRMVAKRKAKKVANHLRRAADNAKGMAVWGVKLRKAFTTEYAEILSPPRKPRKRVLNWKG